MYYVCIPKNLCIIDTVRAVMLKKMVGEGESITSSSKIDLSKLPPCHHSLVPPHQTCKLQSCSMETLNIKVLCTPSTNRPWMYT